MYKYIKLFLLLIFIYCTEASAIEMRINPLRFVDTTVSITNVDSSCYVVAELFIIGLQGEIVYLDAILITREEPLVLPPGIGAFLYGSDNIKINIRETQIEENILRVLAQKNLGIAVVDNTNEVNNFEPLTGNDLSLATILRNYAIYRMINNLQENRIYAFLLREIARLHLLDRQQEDLYRHIQQPVPPPIIPIPQIEVVPLSRNQDLTGNAIYHVPPDAINDGHRRPAYMLVTVYIENPDSLLHGALARIRIVNPAPRLLPIRTFLLHPDEDLQRFPGLHIRITAFNYVDHVDQDFPLYLTRIPLPPATLEEGIIEMLRITTNRQAPGAEIYRLTITAIARLRPEIIGAMLIQQPNDGRNNIIDPQITPIPTPNDQQERRRWRDLLSAPLQSANLLGGGST